MNEDLKALIQYRLEQAEESLEAARLLHEHRKYRPAVSCAYYVMFYAILALLVVRSSATSKHSGVISRFDRDFVKTGQFNKRFSKWLHNAFDMRQRADYREMFDINASRTHEIIVCAAEFLTEVRKKLQNAF